MKAILPAQANQQHLDSMNANSLPTFSAVYTAGGIIRSMTFQAVDLAEATNFAAKWGVGVTGEIVAHGGDAPLPPPDAYPWPVAARQLGGVSRSQIYTWLTLGKLDRVPDTRRVLITRLSIERHSKSRG